MRRARSDPEAFADYYRRHFESVLAYLTRRACDAEVGLDLTAETFAQAFIGRHRFRGSTQQEAEGWLFQIAKRQLSRYLRRGKLEVRAVKQLGIEIPRLDDERRARIEELADLNGIRSVLAAELSELSNGQREAVRLRVVEELSYVEVAARLRISEQAARLRVSRALRSLAAALEKSPKLKELRTG